MDGLIFWEGLPPPGWILLAQAIHPPLGPPFQKTIHPSSLNRSIVRLAWSTMMFLNNLPSPQQMILVIIYLSVMFLTNWAQHVSLISLIFRIWCNLISNWLITVTNFRLRRHLEFQLPLWLTICLFSYAHFICLEAGMAKSMECIRVHSSQSKYVSGLGVIASPVMQFECCYVKCRDGKQQHMMSTYCDICLVLYRS